MPGGGARAVQDLDCADFTDQEDAQAAFDADRSDPYGLDGPIGTTPSGEPNVACESLPHQSGAARSSEGRTGTRRAARRDRLQGEPAPSPRPRTRARAGAAGAAPEPMPAPVVTAAEPRSFPASAVIRGENIWLRMEPAEETAIVTYLQRGDAVTITGPEETTRGEAFVPVEVVATDESGWVRELAIAPQGLVMRDDPSVQSDERTPKRPRRRQPRNQTDTPAVAEELPLVEVTPEPAGECDPAYPDLCIPPGSEDLDCAAIDEQDFSVLPPDPHGFDGNGDGVEC